MTSRRLTTAVALAVAAVVLHGAFFAWDRSAEVDPATGSASGPYDTWQVVGATLGLGLLAYAGGRARRAWTSAAAISVAFTVAWSIDAATTTSEDADLWPIGAVLTLVGTSVWTLLIALVAQRRTRSEPVGTAPPADPRRLGRRPATPPRSRSSADTPPTPRRTP